MAKRRPFRLLSLEAFNALRLHPAEFRSEDRGSEKCAQSEWPTALARYAPGGDCGAVPTAMAIRAEELEMATPNGRHTGKQLLLTFERWQWSPSTGGCHDFGICAPAKKTHRLVNSHEALPGLQ